MKRLEACDLTARWGSFELGPLSLEIEAGEIFAVLGRTGAGKTVLLEAMAGMFRGDGGRALLDGVKEVRLFGEDIAVNAEIAVLHGTSGHADQKGLLNWVEAFEKKPETIFVNHGDTEACEAFQALLQEKGYVAVAPFSGAEFDLVSGKFLAFPEGCPIAKRGAARKKGVFDALIAAAQRLLLVAQSCKERPNRDLTRFTAQIQALIDRWEK